MQDPSNPIVQLGLADSRRGAFPFGIFLRDRMQHLYVIGKTGTGKSTLLLNMARQDAGQGTGFCFMDPHGDLADALAPHLPKSAILWNVADPLSPYGYNPLTKVTPALRPLVASGLIETLKKQWAEAWGVRMEHLLRHALLALLDQPTADLRDIVPLFLDNNMRRTVVANIEDPQVRKFWAEEYPAMNYKTAADGVAPIANKLSTFLTHPVIRRALCEPAKPLRFRALMDAGTPLIINLNKGRLGADITNVLGGLIISSLTHAAFTRQDQPEAARRPYFAYVDEFHAFTTEALADTLAECRKYGLALILAQQHTAQSPTSVFTGIMGNTGNLICFRLGPQDAPLIAQQLGEIAPRDLINLPNYQTYMRVMVQGRQTKVFSAATLPPQLSSHYSN